MQGGIFQGWLYKAIMAIFAGLSVVTDWHEFCSYNIDSFQNHYDVMANMNKQYIYIRRLKCILI
jgi:hypothetical protein